MTGAGDAQQVHRDPGLLERGLHDLGVAVGHDGVRVAVDEQHRRIVRGDVGHRRRRDEAPVLDRVGPVRAAEPEQGVVASRRREGQVGRRGPGHDRLHLRALPVHGAGVAAVAVPVEHAEQAHEMAAGRAAHRPDALRVDAVLGRVVAHEADRPLRVLEMGGMPEPRRGAVVDGEHRVAGGGEGDGVDVLLPGLLQGRGVEAELAGPAAAGDEHDAVPVRLLRMVDVHQQREPGVHAEDHVAVHPPLGAGETAGQDHREDADANQSSH